MSTTKANIRLSGTLCAFISLSSGCSLLYADEIDKKQCKSDADCASRSDGGESLVCDLTLAVCTGPGDAGFEPQACTQNKDCAAGTLCGFDGFCYQKWGCLDDDADWPSAPSSFAYSASLASLKNPENPDLLGDSVEVLACSSGDPDCASPIATGALDREKNLELKFESFKGTQFNGFIRIRDKAAVPGSAEVAFLPGYIHYGSETRLVSDMFVQTRIFLVDPQTYQGLAALSGTAADPNAGTVVFIMQDCGGRSAARVAMKPEGTSSYEFVAVQGGNQPVPGATATTEDGAGLLLNIPPDQARTFVLSDEESGRVIDNVSINVRGRATNYVYYYPRYSALKKWLEERARLAQ